ncbi:Uncharacterised protein [Mycobacteroides abscessus subsp. abscessus]|nr:Uncharacterised protein [Mycobacteroides abscessus subsp. abscessus]
MQSASACLSGPRSAGKVSSISIACVTVASFARLPLRQPRTRATNDLTTRGHPLIDGNKRSAIADGGSLSP